MLYIQSDLSCRDMIACRTIESMFENWLDSVTQSYPQKAIVSDRQIWIECHSGVFLIDITSLACHIEYTRTIKGEYHTQRLFFIVDNSRDTLLAISWIINAVMLRGAMNRWAVEFTT